MALERQVLYEFDSFRLNPADHSLRCGGKPVPLTPKSFDILVTLIESNGRLVTKDELMKKIWPDSFVEEANLTVNVSALRKALGDTPEHQQYIETVPKLGYRFIASVTARQSGNVGNSLRPPIVDETIQPPEAQTKQPELVSAPAVVPAGGSGLSFRSGLWAAALVAATVATLVFWQLHKTPVTSTTASQPRSLAILPFQNLKHDASSDFLGYSLADAIITRLGYVQSLRVRPSYAVEKYRDQVVEIPKLRRTSMWIRF